MKSLNSMCSELGLCLAKPRCKDEQNEYASKWNELSTLDIDLSLFRPVYAPKDFLEILSQVSYDTIDLIKISGKNEIRFAAVSRIKQLDFGIQNG